ncbi:MAG: SDR family oxidoreductase [Gammaproteobacteria bacterium]|nr:SDR family oxidoreductase [Gammaproteobacteria bacterium]
MKTSIKTALVTGASRGIGRAIALRLAEDGFAVVVNYAAGQEKAEQVVAQIQQAGGRAVAVQADVADAAAVEQLFATAKLHFGRVDVVVNSAGILTNVSIADCSTEQFAQLVRTNLTGAFCVLGSAARHINQGGRIIALSTSVIGKALPSYGPYIATKAAVEGLVHVLANELRGLNITVNAVAPGPVATELFLNGKSDELIQQMAKLAPLERLGTPEDIAAVVSMLAGPDGAWINSQVIRVNGGMV